MAYVNPYAQQQQGFSVKAPKKLVAISKKQERPAIKSNLFTPSLAQTTSTDPLKSIPKEMRAGGGESMNFSPIKKEVQLSWGRTVPIVDNNTIPKDKAKELVIGAIDTGWVIRKSVLKALKDQLPPEKQSMLFDMIEQEVENNPDIRIEWYNYEEPQRQRTLNEKVQWFVEEIPAGIAGIAQGAADVWWAIGEWLAYLDPTITTEEYRRGNENIDTVTPAPLARLKATKWFGVGRELGKIWASAALTAPIWGTLWAWAKTLAPWVLRGASILWAAATEWALWQKVYNKASWNGTNDWVLASAGLNALIPWAWLLKGSIWKWLGKWWKKLFTSWLMNPRALEYTTNALAKWWEQVWDVVDRAVKKGIKWTDGAMVRQLWDIAKENKMQVLDNVSSMWGNVKSDSIIWALEEMKSSLVWSRSTQQLKKLEAIDNLIAKAQWEWLSRSEVQRVKEGIDDLSSIYTQAWDIRAWQWKVDLANLRWEIRKMIEDEGSKYWFDLQTLNRDIAVSKAMQKWLTKKNFAFDVREIMSPFSSPMLWAFWWLVWWSQTEGSTWDKVKAAFGWMLVGATLGSKEFKTNIGTKMIKFWKYLDNVPSTDKSTLQLLIWKMDDLKANWNYISERQLVDDAIAQTPWADDVINNVQRWWDWVQTLKVPEKLAENTKKKALSTKSIKNVANSIDSNMTSAYMTLPWARSKAPSKIAKLAKWKK